MANQKHLDIFKSGRDAWNKWREDNEGLEPDLSGTKLLVRAKLAGFNLRHTNFEGTDLREAKIDVSDLSGADLRKADLRHATCRGVSLIGANLARANLREAEVTTTLFGWVHVDCPDSIHIIPCGTILTGADFTEAEIAGCFFPRPISATQSG